MFEICLREGQPSKAHDTTWLHNKRTNEEHSLKAYLPIFISDEGLAKVTLSNDAHFWNAASPIIATNKGMKICWREVQLKNDFLPIVVTEGGISIRCNDVQFWKSESSIDVNVWGSVILNHSWTAPKKHYIEEKPLKMEELFVGMTNIHETLLHFYY